MGRDRNIDDRFRIRGERQNPTITVSVEEHHKEMLKQLCKTLAAWRKGKRVNRSYVIREAITVLYDWIINGKMPKG